MTARRIRVAVLFGGRSSEHEISVVSAASIIEALDPDRFTPVPVAIERSGAWLGTAESAAMLPTAAAARCGRGQIELRHEPGLSRGFDVVFPALHGPYGEDGRVQGLLDMADVPYVGSGVLGSACAMDKDMMKRLLNERGIPTLPHLVARRGRAREACLEVEEGIGYPVFVKPANLGSSVGIRKAAGREELAAAVDYAGEFDRKVIIEPAVDAREIECSVLGNDQPEASVPGEIVTKGGFYDYEAKYESQDAELIAPAILGADEIRSVQSLAIEAFRAAECWGLARVDFFIDKATGKIWVNEVNTMPGFTSISMYPRMWAASGLEYPRLLARMIDLAIERHARTREIRFDRQ